MIIKKSENTKGPKLFTTSYCLLILVSFMTSLSYSLIQTLIATYAVDLGGTLAAAGTLTGLFSTAAMICRPAGGALCDEKNKKIICLVSTMVFAFGFFGYALSMNMTALLIFRLLHGAAFGISGTANMALVAESIPRQRMGEGLGYYGVGQVVSQIIGPVFGVALHEMIGFKALFLLVGCICFGAIIVLALIPYENRKPEADSGEISDRKKKTGNILGRLIAANCIIYALTAGMFSFMNGVTSSFLVMVGEERNIPHIALFFTVNAICLFTVRLLMGKIADEAPLTLVVTISLLVGFSSMFLLSKAAVLPMFLVAAILKALGQGVGQISLQSACVKSVDESRVGVASSTYYIGADVGNSLGPIIGGTISGAYGYATMFQGVAWIAVAMIGVFLVYELSYGAKKRKGMKNGCVQI
jgi:MFS family permease